MGAANFIISRDLLAKLIQLPDDCEIKGAEWDFISNGLRVYIVGTDLPECSFGQLSETIFPLVEVNWCDNGEIRHHFSYRGVNHDR